MLQLILIAVTSITFLLASACKSQATQTDSSNPLNPIGGADHFESINRLEQEHLDDQQRIKNEQKQRQEQIDSLERRINELKSQITSSQKRNTQDLADMKAEIVQLEDEKKRLDAEAAELRTKSSNPSSSVSTSSTTSVATSNTVGVSGFPLCGSTYYGTEWSCGTRQCAKSDIQYRNTCEISAESKKGVPSYPLCGSTYYGEVFSCNGKRCAKADASYSTICELP